MKKFLSVILSMVLIISIIPSGLFTITASAATSGYYIYTVSNGEATIYDVDTSISGAVTIPSILGGYPVTKIDDYAFRCPSLTSITIPDSVTSINLGAFYKCSSLTSITIGDGVTSIHANAFSMCTKLTSITVDSANKHYSSQNGFLFNKDKTQLIKYPNGKASTTYTIPDSVTSVGDWAFLDCDSLTSITIPDSVTSIGGGAFENCSSLISITIPDSVTSIGDYAFRGCSSLTSITIPNSVTSIGNYAFYDCSKLTSITIPDSVTSIGDYAFSDCSKLTSITIPDSVTRIGVGAFDDCDSLTSITIPDSVTRIGDSAFSSCYKLTSITIPDSVTSIGGSAFSWCSKLTSITIPDSVTSIGDYAFRGCSSLTSITIPNSVTSIGNYAFYDCSRIDDIWYKGSYADKSNISIGSSNSALTSATWHYDTCDAENHVYSSLCDGGCNNCDWTRPVPDNILHIYDNNCDTDCNVCDETRTITHNYEWVIDTQETCGESGLKHEECTVCHTKRNENTVIDATGNHKYGNNCDTICDICGNIRTITHAYEWVIDENETCGKTGTKHEECTVCHTKRNENTTIGKKDHTFDNDSDIVCNVCGHVRTIYHITFDLNGGTGTFEQVIKDSGKTLILPTTTPSRSGYSFAGWSLSKNGDVEYLPDDSFEINKSVTLYAQWDLYCEECNGNGRKYQNCKTCGGDGKVEVGSKITCSTCNNKKFYCLKCGSWGNGNILDTTPCWCGSRNWYWCESCDGAGGWWQEETCSNCKGNGKSYYACSPCNGTGDYIRASVSAPSAPILVSKTATSFILQEIQNGEYSMDGVNWQDSPIFENLTSNKTYTVYQRYAKTDTTLRSETSQGLSITLISAEKCSHEYDDICDAFCNICGSERTDIHSFDNNCDTACNNCSYLRTVGDHIYANVCDTICNECGFERTVNHVFTNSCDTLCNICNHERTISHTYDNNSDSICNVCGHKRQYFTITYNGNGEVGTPTSQTLPEDISITLPNATSDYYQFLGWSKTPYGEVDYKKNSSYIVTENITLYAKWGDHCFSCNDTGRITNTDYKQVLCTICSGTGEVSCSERRCNSCYSTDIRTGSTYNPSLGTIYHDYCGDCGGQGIARRNRCSSCDGDGYRYDWVSATKSCSNCGGKGFRPIAQVKAPKPELVSKTTTSVTLRAIDGVDYSADGEIWQDSNVFNNLTPGKEYYFYLRYKANSVHTVGSKGSFLCVVTNSLTPSAVTSTKHTIKGNNISKITAGTTVSSLLSGLNEGSYCKVYKGNSVVSGNTVVGTGMVVKIMDGNTVKASYTVIVTGDTNGDGAISVTDMIAIKAHILNKSTLTGVYATAANTNGDSGISITDFIQVKAKILGKGSITAR